jgi:uncharacterized membrane protein
VTAPAPAAGDRAVADAGRLPSHTDDMAQRATGGIGGPWGRHAVAGRWWTPIRVLLAFTCFTLLLGYLQKAPCADGNWTGHKQYTHMCYSDVVPLWSDERLDVGALPYRDTSVEYPVLTGAFMWTTGELTRAVHAIDQGWSELIVFGLLTALLLGACGLVVTAATAQAAGHRPYDAALFALSPLLVFHAFSNWDLFAMALTSGALWAWATRRPVLAGVLIGLGTAAKLYPVLLLLPLWLLAVRTRRFGGAGWATAAAAGSWLAVNVPLALAYPHGWSEFYRFSIDRPAERSTVWAIGNSMVDSTLSAADSTYWVPPGAAVALLLGLALLGVAALALLAPHRPRVGQLAFLVVLAFLLTTKVWSPQYSLWLVPLLALARPRWRLSLVWQFTEIAVWFLTLTLLLGLDPQASSHGVTYSTLVVAIVARDVLLLVIAALIVREMWHPELDAVRAGGVDDPGGGEFDGAYDVPRASRRYAMSAP